MTVIRAIEAILGRPKRGAERDISRWSILNSRVEVSDERTDPVIEDKGMLTRATEAAGQDWELRLKLP